MSSKTNFQGISKRGRLLLSAGESKDVDYKEQVKGLHAEDLVAFANSKSGGAILIGVREINKSNTTQKGEPIGHAIDDDSRLQIMGKALACNPPIQIEIYIENTNALPFYRIEIPSGAYKPYATNGGIYKIREDGRNNPILPEQLLNLFLEREGNRFKTRFSEATGQLESKMAETLGLVESLEDKISSKIKEMGDTLGWAEYKVGESADTIESVHSQVLFLMKETKKQTQRIRAVIKKLGADDPVKKRIEEETLSGLIKKLKEDHNLFIAAEEGKALSVSLQGEAAEELDKEDINHLFTKALDKILAENK